MNGRVELRSLWNIGRLERNWRSVLVGLVLILEAGVFAPEIPLNGGRPWIGKDPMLFQYMGWYWTNHGGVPYLHVWDVKAPLAHEIPALVAVFTGDNMIALAVVGIVLSIGAVLAGVLLAGTLVEEITGDGLAALATGLVMVSYPYMFKQPAWGFRPKAMLIVCGLLSIYFLCHERWMLSGATGAAAAGFWQLGIIFPVIAIAGGFQNGRRAGLYAVAGAGILTTIVVAPFVLAGPMAIRAMLGEVVVAPLLDPPSSNGLSKALLAPRRLDFGLPTALVGGITALLAWRASNRLWWLSVVTVWFGFQALYLDPHHQDDLIVGMAIVGIGYGLHVGNVFGRDGYDDRVRLVLVGGAAGLLTLNIWHAGLSLDSVQPMYETLEPGTLDYYYWNAVPPETCHIRQASDEYTFVREMGGEWDAQLCGQYSLAELWQAVVK